jgi:hypothetical protein
MDLRAVFHKDILRTQLIKKRKDNRLKDLLQVRLRVYALTFRELLKKDQL